jgi:hypothetical protein
MDLPAVLVLRPPVMPLSLRLRLRLKLLMARIGRKEQEA